MGCAGIITPDFVRGMTATIQYEAARESRRAVAEEVRTAAPISSAYRPSVVYYDPGYRRSYWDWSTTTVTNHYHGPVAGPRQKSQEEKDEDRAWMATVIGSIIAIAAAALVGHTYSRLTTQRESLHQMQEVRDGLLQGRIENLTQRLQGAFSGLVDVQLTIDELKTRKVSHYFLSAMGVFMGGLALASGGLWMMPWLITAGQVMALGGALGGMMSLGLHWNDESKMAKQREIILGNPDRQLKGLADHILEMLASPAQQPYQPLVPSAYTVTGTVHLVPMKDVELINEQGGSPVVVGTVLPS